MGGFDSRKIVLYNLDPNWDEETLLGKLQRLGHVFSLRMPRDYEVAPEFSDCTLEVPTQYMKFLARTPESAHVSGHYADHKLRVVRKHIEDQVRYLTQCCAVHTTNVDIRTVFNDLYEL